AAPFRSDRGAEEPQLLHSLDEIGGVLVGVLVLARDRYHLALDESAHGLHQLCGQLGMLGLGGLARHGLENPPRLGPRFKQSGISASPPAGAAPSPTLRTPRRACWRPRSTTRPATRDGERASCRQTSRQASPRRRPARGSASRSAEPAALALAPQGGRTV